jgi:fatty-acyl-CoA synthase
MPASAETASRDAAPLRGESIVEIVDAWARVRPRMPAIVSGGRTLTFQDLVTRSRQAACGLRALGIRQGECVAIWLPNMPEWIEMALACGRVGATVVSTNSRFRSVELGDLLERTAATTLVFAPRFDVRQAEILADVPATCTRALKTMIACGGIDDRQRSYASQGKAIFRYEQLLEQGHVDGPPVDPDERWVMFTTSGTTSRPKLVMHSHRTVARHSIDVARAHRFDFTTTVDVPHPISGVLGFTPTFGALAAGAAVVLQERFDAQRVAADLIRHRVTNVWTIDEGLVRLLDAVEGTPSFPDLRFAMFGALNGPPEDYVRRADARGLRCVGSYGMTEVHAGFTLQRIDGSPAERAPGGGFPINPDARIRVRDPETGRVLGPTETGDVELYTPSMMLGYFEDRAATQAAFTSDGYLRTGDSGFLLPDGSFRFVARTADTLKLRGFLVSPMEISSFVETHGAVSACQVVGATGHGSMTAVGFVVVRPGEAFDEAALVDHCRRGLASYKVPGRFFAVDAFPTTDGPNGPKVQRVKLREMAKALLAQKE